MSEGEDVEEEEEEDGAGGGAAVVEEGEAGDAGMLIDTGINERNYGVPSLAAD